MLHFALLTYSAVKAASVISKLKFVRYLVIPVYGYRYEYLII